MHARITQYRLPPEKVGEFISAVAAVVPHARQQKGFAGLLVFQVGTGTHVDVRVVSMWNSLEDLTAGEQNFYFYQALSKAMAFSKGFPLIETQEVLFSDFNQDRDNSADETLY
jgi:heme-degrading monooxygenase HmoA